LLEKSRSAAKGATIEDHFEAVRHVSSYLTWTGDGKPYAKRIDNLVDALEGVLAQAGGDAKRDFESCRQEFAASEQPGNTTDLARAAELKICVDRARSNLAGRVVVNR
jgi:hypothetical protein